MNRTLTKKAASDSRAERLARLRGELANRALAGFLVPRADEHQGEYVAPRSERLAWLTGFTGSAGLAIVLAERAAIFVDGRYTLQAAAQIDPRGGNVGALRRQCCCRTRWRQRCARG